MSNDDVPNLPVSRGEEAIRSLDKRDKFTRGLAIVILLFVVAFNIYTIQANKADTLKAREANTARQAEIKEYIRCIVLLRYDNPTLTAQSPREDVENALDKCANRTDEI